MLKHCLLWVALAATRIGANTATGKRAGNGTLKGVLELNSLLSCPGRLALQLDGRQLGDAHGFRVQVFDGDGQELTMLTRDLAASSCTCTWELPLAIDLRELPAHCC